MSHEAGHDHDHDLNQETDHVPRLDRAPEPLMERDHDSDSADRDDKSAPESEAEAEAAPNRPSFVATVLAMLAKIPRPSLGSERHEVFPDEPHLPPQAVDSAEPALPPARPRPAGRFPGLAMRRETRVGIAALLSFVILVGALIAKRSWGGKPTPALALAGPLGDESTPAVPDVGKGEEGAKPESPKAEKDQEKKKEEPSPAPDTKSTEPPAGDPAGSKPRLPSETTGPADPVALPPTTESSTPAVLPSTLPTDTAALPPDANTPKPPAPPAGPVDPLPIPGGVEMPSASPPSLPSAPTELPPTSSPSSDSKPKETEINPPSVPASAPTPAAPPLGDPPSLTPIVEPSQPPPVVAEPAAPPVVTQAPSPSPSPTPSPTPPPTPASTRPIPTEKPPTFESVSSVEASTTRASTAGSLGAGWVMIPSGGRRIVGAVPIVSTPAEAHVEPPRVADGPKYADDPAAADQVEPFVHEVRPGENFWTISKLYYRSGRFYKALHAANRKQVPDIRQLWVGTVLRIPPPEALDRSLIDPPSRSNGGDEPSTSIVSRTSKRLEPPDEADLGMPVRPRRVAPDPEAVEAPRRPTHKVKAHETLRSIARDTLNDPKRDREIYNLNRDVLDDINVLPAGTVLTLPADASSSRGVK